MFHVDITAPAEIDAESIYNWLAERSVRELTTGGRSSARQSRRSARVLLALGMLPNHASMSLICMFKTRYGDRYRLVYMIRDETVYVLRVRATGQQLLSKDDIEVPKD